MSKKVTITSKGIAHHSPGRTRIKLPKSQRQHLHHIKEQLAKTPGVKSVEVNHSTGSVLVHHDHDMPIFEVLHKTAEAVGTDLLTTLIEGETVTVLGPLGIIAAGLGLVSTVGKSFIASNTAEGCEPAFRLPVSGRTSDLKTLIPAAFFIAAAYKTYETRTFWQGLTPFALVYWGFDTYWRFNVANPTVFEPKNGQLKEHEGQHN